MSLLLCEVNIVDKINEEFTAVECAEFILENMNPNALFDVETLETSVHQHTA